MAVARYATSGPEHADSTFQYLAAAPPAVVVAVQVGMQPGQ